MDGGCGNIVCILRKDCPDCKRDSPQDFRPSPARNAPFVRRRPSSCPSHVDFARKWHFSAPAFVHNGRTIVFVILPKGRPPFPGFFRVFPAESTAGTVPGRQRTEKAGRGIRPGPPPSRFSFRSRGRSSPRSRRRRPGNPPAPWSRGPGGTGPRPPACPAVP